jgi:hypothetical protein
MASSFPAYIAWGRKSDRVEEFVPSQTAGQTFGVAQFVYYDTSTNVIRLCGADPALIAGFSEVDSEANRVITPNGKVPIYLLETVTMLALSSTTTPAESHVGDQHGITRTAGGIWQLDTAKTGADARMIVRRVDIPNGIFYCQPLNDQLQFATIA